MDDLDKLENHIKTGKPEEFIKNCFCCVSPDFMEMCRVGRVAIVKWMIEHGTNVHDMDDCARRRALHLAGFNGHIEVVELLTVEILKSYSK